MNKTWKPALGQRYWGIFNNTPNSNRIALIRPYVDYVFYYDDKFDRHCINTGNYFRTRQLARTAMKASGNTLKTSRKA